MKPKTWIVGGAAAVLLALAVGWAFTPRPVEVELATVTQGLFATTIDEDGKTRLTDRYVVSSPLAGKLARITLKEGDAVEADMALARLSSVLPAMRDERTLRELQARVESARDNVQRAQTRIARSQVSLDQAKSEFRRSEQLALQGFIAPARLDADRLLSLGVQREVELAAADRRIAAHDLEQARAALGVTREPTGGAGQRSFTVRAPSAGRVLRVLQPSEGPVALGAPLFEIGDIHRLEIVAELLTTDALTARPGSRVMIERWGGPATLEGRVRSIEPAAFTKVSALGVEEQRVRVLIDITSPQPEWQALGDGYRVSVRIVTLAEDKAVQVPVSAVFPLPAESTGNAGGDEAAALRYAVFIADGGRALQTSVVLGARNGSAAWIRGGLTPGQQVIVYPPAAVRDGVRVKARKV